MLNKMENLNYVVKNATPIRWGNIQGDAISGIEHVAPEVLVSMVLQRMFGIKGDNYADMALAHTLSIPFIGGAQPFGDGNHAKMEAQYTDQLVSGASGVPGLMLGYYLAGIFNGEDILRWTKWGVQDFIVVALGKILTRPVMTSLDKLLAKDNFIRTNYDALQARFDLQTKNSNFKFGG